MTATSGTLAVLLALLAAVPWSIALSGPDRLFVALAVAPPLLMGALLWLRRTVQEKRARWDSNPVPRC